MGDGGGRGVEDGGWGSGIENQRQNQKSSWYPGYKRATVNVCPSSTAEDCRETYTVGVGAAVARGVVSGEGVYRGTAPVLGGTAGRGKPHLVACDCGKALGRSRAPEPYGGAGHRDRAAKGTPRRHRGTKQHNHVGGTSPTGSTGAREGRLTFRRGRGEQRAQAEQLSSSWWKGVSRFCVLR